MTVPPPAMRLSAQHVEVLRLVAMGLSNEQIGRHLFLSEHTVRTHLARAFRVLGATSRVHAVVLAAARGHLVIDERKGRLWIAGFVTPRKVVRS